MVSAVPAEAVASSRQAKNEARIRAALAEIDSASAPGPFILLANDTVDFGGADAVWPLIQRLQQRWPKNDRVLSLGARYARIAPDLAEARPQGIGEFRRLVTEARKSDDQARLIEASESALAAFPDDVWAAENLFRTLGRAARVDRAIQVFERLPASSLQSPAVVYHAYTIAYRAGDGRAAAIRDQLVTTIAASAKPDLWTGRLARLENDSGSALAAFARAAAAFPDDPEAVRELAAATITHGQFGAYAANLLKAEQSGNAEQRATIASIRTLFAAAGGSLEMAAAGQAPSVLISSPQTPFDLICAERDVPRYTPTSRLMMIGGSLAAGGAERILSTLFSSYRRRYGPDEVRLALFDMQPGEPTSFYLPDTGVDASEILRARTDIVTHPQIAWLPKPMAVRAQGIFDHIVAHRPAVVHATLDFANLCAGYAAILAGVPKIVLHIHNMRPTELAVAKAFNPEIDRCYAALLRRDDVHLVGVANAAVTDYLDWIASPSTDRTHVIENGFDFAPFDGAACGSNAAAVRRELGLEDDAPLIGTAFRFTELKRPDWWLAMASAVANENPRARFILFGDGELLEPMRALAAELNIADRVHFPGRVSNLHELIGALDLFVLTSRTEGLPNVLIEAQAAGVPVVTFNVGGARETLLEGVTGTVVEEQSLDALITSVSRMLASPGDLRQAREHAKAYVRERFNVARMVTEMSIVLGLDGNGSEAIEP